MNPAPAELLQLLTIAALQPTSTGNRLNTFSLRYPYGREKKKPPCLNFVRQCGFVFFASLACILIESVSYYSIDYYPDGRDNITCSRFDKFNHVTYTKTL
jgi:hypothetical protein